jgi:hypothetical protein
MVTTAKARVTGKGWHGRESGEGECQEFSNVLADMSVVCQLVRKGDGTENRVGSSSLLMKGEVWAASLSERDGRGWPGPAWLNLVHKQQLSKRDGS